MQIKKDLLSTVDRFYDIADGQLIRIYVQQKYSLPLYNDCMTYLGGIQRMPYDNSAYTYTRNTYISK